jgi:hypothetical protein
MRDCREQRGAPSAGRLLLGHNSGAPALLHFVGELPHGIFGYDSAFAGSE